MNPNKKYYISGKEKYLLDKIKEMYNTEVALRARKGEFTNNYQYINFLQDMIDHYKLILDVIYKHGQ